jgi:predicted permease
MLRPRLALSGLLRHLFRRNEEERELSEELRAHVDLLADEKIASGMPAEQARRTAAIELGGVAQVEEAVRDVRPGRLLEQSWQDARHAVRSFARTPGFTAIAVLTLALGIGASSAIFSVLEAVLIRPLPYPHPDRLVLVWSALREAGQSRVPASGPEFMEVRRRSRTLEDLAGIWVGSGTLADDGSPEQVRLGQVTANFLSLLGVRPQAGRFFAPGEEGPSSSPVVVVSDGLWRRRFGGDPGLPGRTVRLEGASVTVVGVLPAGFEVIFPSDASVPGDIDVFMPFRNDLASMPRDLAFIRMVGRLRAGISPARARSELAAVATRLRAEFREYATQGLDLEVTPLHRDAVRDVRPILIALFCGVGLVALIACVNVANLLLARATRREREIALRSALGASRWRLARQLLTESLLLAGIGGLFGLAVGRGGLQLLLAMRPDRLARIQSAGLSTPVLGFTFAASCAIGILCGLAPVLATRRRDLSRAFTDRSGAGPRRAGPRRMLVLAEVALGFVLLAGTALTVRTFINLLRADPGFRADGVLTFQIAPPRVRYPDDASRQRLFRQLQEKVEALPGVTAAGAVSHLPLGNYPNWYEFYWKDGAPASEQNTLLADHRAILPGFFRSLGVGFVAGRDFTAHDDPEHPNVIIVDEALADRTWPGESAIGRFLNVSFIHHGSFDPTRAEVVGVVRHVRYHDLAEEGRGQVYVPYLQSARELLAFTVRTDGDPESLTPSIRSVVEKLDPELALSRVRPLSGYVESSLQAYRFTMTIAAVLAGLALLLACIGIYGVVSFSVASRTSEIGVRMALGGAPRRVLWLIVGETLRLAVAGLAAGLAVSLLMTGLLGRLLYGVGPRDPAALVAAGLLLMAAGMTAAIVPARRATKIEPMAALRHE